MKRTLLLSILFLLSLATSFAQEQDDLIKWNYSLSETDITVGDKINIELTVDIDDKWYIYGAQFDCDPQNTEVDLSEGTNTGYKITGKLQSAGDKEKYDDIFLCDYRYFHGKGTFTLPIEITEESGQINGEIIYQLCTVKDGMCIPFQRDLNLTFTAKKKTSPVKVVDPKEDNELGANTNPTKNPPYSNSNCECCDSLQAHTAEILARLDNLNSGTSYNQASASVTNGGGETCSVPRTAGWDDIDVIRYEQEEKGEDWLSLLIFMGVAFLAGLTAIFTPCVFPMIPMTVAFFTKSAKSRAQGITQALFYGFFIIFIYVLIGAGASALFGPNFGNLLSTHWLPNGIFFIIFIIFALSFLGLFEITLPNSVVNKVDQQSDKGGLAGVFFMSFTLVLVSFSCTGPIVGSILIESADGQLLKPIIGMLGFGLAFALPFMLFALFPSWLNGLPKSGGWLNSVKVVLGLLELAFAFKFLSQIDLIEGWGILDREIFLAIWIAVFFIIGIYLMGKIQLPHDSPLEKVGVFRLLIIISAFTFVTYMVPGMWGAPLKALSGMLPPRTTQDFDTERMIREFTTEGNEICEEPMYADHLELPHGLNGYFDLRQAICCAVEQNKPIFLDFTGKGCANCRKMEESVWIDPKVYEQLSEDYIIVAMYGDVRKLKLLEGEEYNNKDGDKINRLGEAVLDFQREKFSKNAQPYYAVVGVNKANSNEKNIELKELAPSRPYDENVDEFVKFLKEGTENYAKLN